MSCKEIQAHWDHKSNANNDVNPNKLIYYSIFRCYVRALKLYPECSAQWHDLGVNYIHQSAASSAENAGILAEKAAQALKKAIQLDANNYRHWNALGYVACQKGI